MTAPTDASSGDGAFFDRLVADDGDFNPFAERGWRTLARRFEQAVGGRRGLRILDVGCGTGRSRAIYRASEARYVGVDLSFRALTVGRTRAPEAAFVHADGFHLPFTGAAFDIVAFSSVLHHVSDIGTALAEGRRVAAPGALVFAFDPNLLHPAMLLFRHPRSPLYRHEGVSAGERPLAPGTLRRAFDAAGLRAIGQRCQSNLPYRHVAPPLLNACLPMYNTLDRVWEWLGAGRWFGTFVVTWGRVPDEPPAMMAGRVDDARR
jgi:SAM-dependent methyltransferase